MKRGAPIPARRKVLRRVLQGAVIASSGLSLVSAQSEWPDKPIKIIVPFPPGGGVDLTARIVAERLAQQFGQPVVVENRAGGSGTIGSYSVARSPSDGYTLILHSSSTAVVNAVTLKNLRYDPINDFVPVTQVSKFPLVMIINKDLPAKSIGEFIALVRSSPGKYSYGSSGVGTTPHIAGELFESLAKVDMMHVPYKGTAPVLTDLIGGRVHMLIDGVPPQMPNITTGRVRAMAVTTAARSDMLPEIPALAESLPGYEIDFWTGLFAPAKTPRAIVDRIATEVQKALRHRETLEALKKQGIDAVGSGPQEFDVYWKRQLAVYEKVVNDANIRVE